MFSLRAYFLLLVFIYTNAFCQDIGYTKIDIPANVLILEKLVLIPQSGSTIEKHNTHSPATDQYKANPELHGLQSLAILPNSITLRKKLHPGYYLVEVSNNGIAKAVIADASSVRKPYRPGSWHRIIIAFLFLLLLLCCSIGYYIHAIRNNTLRQANKNHELLFHIVAHDLRSPLNHYNGLGEILHELIKSGQYDRLEKVGQEIEGAGHKLDVLISNLLAWSFLPQQKKKIPSDKVSISNVLQEILPFYVLIAESKKIVVHTSLDHSAVIMTDKNIFSLITRNLIDNAIKHSPVGSDIFISSQKKSGTLLFSFKNEYSTEQKSHLKNIAFLFNQNSLLSPEQFKGSGLRFIKEFIETINGHIEINFEERFVTWAITLPIKGKSKTKSNEKDIACIC